MRDMVGGSYIRSLKETFIPELVSMNLLMTGMIPTMKFFMPRIDGAGDPLQVAFWFTMSMAMIVGFALAYPVNWWLVVNNMKHGMLTIRPPETIFAGTDEPAHAAHDAPAGHDDHDGGPRPGPATILAVSATTFAILLACLWLAGDFFV